MLSLWIYVDTSYRIFVSTGVWCLLLKWIVYRSRWLLPVPSKRTCHFLSISFHATCMGKTSHRMQHAVQQRNRKQVENEISEDRNYHRRRNRSSRVTFPFHPRRNSLCFQRSFDSCLDSKGLRGWRREVIRYVRMWYDLPKATNTFARDTKPNISFLFLSFSFSDVKETIKVKTIYYTVTVTTTEPLTIHTRIVNNFLPFISCLLLKYHLYADSSYRSKVCERSLVFDKV